MSNTPYLIQLNERLTSGLAGLEPERRQRHARFILEQQNDDGGFSGREGDSDLYYSSFAVRGLIILGEFNAERATKLADYLRLHPWKTLNIIDLMNWLSMAVAVQVFGGLDLLADELDDWPDRIAKTLEAVRTGDGGYAKSEEGAAGSTYHSFLILLAYQLIGRDVPNPNSLIQFLYDRQRDDGGFVEIAPMKRSGTNPTAAAAAMLNILGGMDDELREDIKEFLLEVQAGEGGFQANTRIPFSDGLSSFTGMLTAIDNGFFRIVNTDLTHSFLTEWLEFPTGGFRGASWDENADVEYTFYGLGCLALLNSVKENI